MTADAPPDDRNDVESEADSGLDREADSGLDREADSGNLAEHGRMGEDEPSADDDSSAGVDPAHQRAFDAIWTQRPEKQNRTSSAWWFFILFPEGEDGYGPRQLMFSIATRVGDRIRINDVPMTGLALNRSIEGGVDTFHAMSVGWDGDDEAVDEHIVKHPAETVLSAADESIKSWSTGGEDGERRGGEIRASEDHSLGLEAEFVGERGTVAFEAWGDLDSRVSAPVEAMDIDTPVGSTNVIAWRRMQFEGEFDLPAGRETLEGLCYFQRVCMNVPLFPWKWIWAFFPDGTAFSAMIPYVGPHVFRKGYRFFDSQTLERSTIPLRQSALWDWGSSEKLVEFDRASITPIIDGQNDVAADAGSDATAEGPAHPDFAVTVRNDQGDHVEFVASTYGHARNYIDRPLLGGLLDSHWTYNEYLFQLTALEGEIGDRAVNSETLGEGYGTLEYSWGLGL